MYIAILPFPLGKNNARFTAICVQCRSLVAGNLHFKVFIKATVPVYDRLKVSLQRNTSNP